MIRGASDLADMGLSRSLVTGTRGAVRQGIKGQSRGRRSHNSRYCGREAHEEGATKLSERCSRSPPKKPLPGAPFAVSLLSPSPPTIPLSIHRHHGLL